MPWTISRIALDTIIKLKEVTGNGSFWKKPKKGKKVKIELSDKVMLTKWKSNILDTLIKLNNV